MNLFFLFGFRIYKDKNLHTEHKSGEKILPFKNFVFYQTVEAKLSLKQR